MKFSEPQSNDPHRFFLVNRRAEKSDSSSYLVLRSIQHGIYEEYQHYKFPDKSALDQELKTKELDGYIQVSDTKYDGALDYDWLIKLGLREPLRK